MPVLLAEGTQPLLKVHPNWLPVLWRTDRLFALLDRVAPYDRGLDSFHNIVMVEGITARVVHIADYAAHCANRPRG
jgi:hypothetical protein